MHSYSKVSKEAVRASLLKGGQKSFSTEWGAPVLTVLFISGGSPAARGKRSLPRKSTAVL
jgi:hypothetical protein